MSIGVVMIVRDEAAVIERALRSTADWAAAWVISDTGSTDRTPELVGEWGADHWRTSYDEAEWADFSTNRNRALDLARKDWPEVDYWLSLDADETAALAPGADPTKLEADLVFVNMNYNGTRYWAPRLIRGAGPCRWQGRCHEVPEGGATQERWEGLELVHHNDGHSSARGRRQARNEMLLRKDLHDHPDNPRVNFYLAQDLKAGGRNKEAIPFFKKRASQGVVMDEEGWYAHYMLGVCQLATGDLVGIDTLLRAVNRRPWRAEPLADLATYYIQQGCEELGKFFAMAADSLPYPEADLMFIEGPLYLHELREVDE